MTEIETARLLLRPWQPDDLAEFTRLLTDPVVTRNSTAAHLLHHREWQPGQALYEEGPGVKG
jgi:RimJ/RimL family protein N-acetyltransferase